MSITHWTLASIGWFLMISAASAQEIKAPDPLFQSSEILDVRIEAPIATLLVERSDEEELPATLQYTSASGESVQFDIQVRTRGKSRLEKDVCRFPPIRLNFKKSQTKDTLFHKQNKVKLVTHCQAASKYEEVLLREYIAYRILNVMTEVSFRVRLLRITYADSDGKKRDTVRYGFIIEHRDRLAKRLEKAVLDIPKTSSRALSPEYANIVSMFHYLIGNTDFSSILSTKGDMCCHNHVLFGNEGEAVWSVPYDFDQAGLVDAPHAGPNVKFSIRSVKQRLYRGRCIHNEHLDTTIASYFEKRDEIQQAIDAVDVASSRSIKSMTSFVGKFYTTLESEKRVNSQLVKKCI